MWYCAHAILYFEFLEPRGDDEEIVVWEHLYLIEAKDPADAYVKAVHRAKTDESSPGDGLRLNGRPARLTFAGIRKTVECQNTDVDHDNPIDGTELSYNELVLHNMADLRRLAKGEPVQVEYSD